MSVAYLARPCAIPFHQRLQRDGFTGGSTAGGDRDAQSAAGWAFPVALVDVMFIVWIYYALRNVQAELLTGGQTAKLAMYRRLSTTLGAFIAIWFLYSIVSILVDRGVVAWPWQWNFVLYSVWDVLYFFLLVAIAWIWRPSPEAARDGAGSQRAHPREEDVRLP